MTVRALKRLDERLLCEVFDKFPKHLRFLGLVLPEAPDRDALDYEAIKEACTPGDIPAEPDDVLFFVCILGNKRGLEMIEGDARLRKVRLHGSSSADLATNAWRQDRPRNRDILDAA